MSDKPLTLHPHELAAAIAGRLRQVRRPVTLESFNASSTPGYDFTFRKGGLWHDVRLADMLCPPRKNYPIKCPFGQPCDVIWGRERCRFFTDLGTFNIQYEIDGMVANCKPPDDWLPPSYDVSSESLSDDCYPVGITEHSYGCRANHMPRWASRWARTVAAVRVERIQDIDEWGCYACGIDRSKSVNPNPVAAYRREWNRHYAAKGFAFEANPWVWVAKLGGEG